MALDGIQWHGEYGQSSHRALQRKTSRGRCVLRNVASETMSTTICAALILREFLSTVLVEGLRGDRGVTRVRLYQPQADNHKQRFRQVNGAQYHQAQLAQESI